MNARKLIATVSMLTMGLAAAGAQATVIADWTFETSQPGSSASVAAEIGTGTASEYGLGTISSPVGNGSSHSYSANGWDNGDYFQFSVSTTGLAGISLSWDQAGSNTGPGSFELDYSTDGGATFDTWDSYTVPTGNFASGIVSTTFSHSYDLSSVTDLDNRSTVLFRLVDTSVTATGAINGGAVGTAGTGRVDNVVVSAVSAVPVPAAVWFFGSGLLGLAGARRRRAA